MRQAAQRSEETAARFLELQRALGTPRQALAKRIAAVTGETFRGVEQKLLRLEGRDGNDGHGLVMPRYKLEPMLRAMGIVNVEETATWYLEGGKRPQLVVTGEAARVVEPATIAVRVSGSARAATGTDGGSVTGGTGTTVRSEQVELVVRATGIVAALERATRESPENLWIKAALREARELLPRELPRQDSNLKRGEKTRGIMRFDALLKKHLLY